MSDAYTSSVVLGCGVEIKESGGDYNEAVLQLGIWCSAGLQKRGELSTIDISPSQKPLLGWTIIGHEWKLPFSWRDEAGNVVGLDLVEWLERWLTIFSDCPWTLDTVNGQAQSAIATSFR